MTYSNSDSPPSPQKESPKESCRWMMERLIIESGRQIDRPRVRRAIQEADEAHGGLNHENWWLVLSEAAESLGFKSKIIDAAPSQALQMALDGAHVCWKTNSIDFSWRAVSKSKHSSVQVLHPFSKTPATWMKPRQFKRLIREAQVDSKVRCVVLQPYEALGIEMGHHASPYQRLKSLLRPEWSDISVVLVFALVAGLLSLATPIAVESLVNTVAFGTLLQPVFILAIILFTFLGFQAMMRALQTIVVEIIQQRMFARISADLAYRLPRTKTEAYDTIYGPELVNRFFDVVTLQKVTAQLFLDGVGLVLSTLIGMAVIGFYHPWLLGFDIVLLALIAFTIFVLGRGAINSSILESKKKYQMAAWLEDITRCPTAFKSEGGAEFALERADQFIDDYLNARQSHFRILFRQIMFAFFLQAVASTVLLGLGGWLVILGQLTLGQLVASELIVTVIVGSFAKLGKHVESFYDLLAAVDKLGQLIDLPIERTDGHLAFRTKEPAKISMAHLSYAYHGRKPIFNELKLEIDPGTHVALTGDPGTGKSTLLDLIHGERPLSSGHLLIDGLDPREMRPDALRRSISLVRDVEIFEGSIAENIHLERPGSSRHDHHEILKRLGVLDELLELPDGLETRLNSSGLQLSDVQRRLLMIARAMSSHPRLLLIDSMLDKLPDSVVHRVLPVVFDPDNRWTSIVATGRQSVIDQCDQIINLSKPKT